MPYFLNVFGSSRSACVLFALSEIKLLLCSQYYTTSPKITSFSATSLCYNVDEGGKKRDYCLGPLPVWSLQIHPVFEWVFSRDSGFLPHPKDVHITWLTCLHCPNRSMGVGLGAPCIGCMCCPEWGSHFVPGTIRRGSSHPRPWTE